MRMYLNEKLTEPFFEFTLKIELSGNAFTKSEWYSPPIASPYSRLYYIADGEAQLKTHDETINMKKGFLYLIPADFIFSHSCDEYMHQLFFHINISNHYGFDMLRGINKILSIDVGEEHINNLIMLHESTDTLKLLQLKSALYNDIVKTLSEHNIKVKNQEYSECVQKALVYIESNPLITISAKDIARECNVSYDTLAHKFKQEMNTSIIKYVSNIVLFKAEEMLIKSNLSILEISEMFGFYDQFYFSRRFKERFGIPPLKYRNQKHITKAISFWKDYHEDN